MAKKDLDDRMDAIEDAVAKLTDRIDALDASSKPAEVCDCAATLAALTDRVSALEAEVFPPKADAAPVDPAPVDTTTVDPAIADPASDGSEVSGDTGNMA